MLLGRDYLMYIQMNATWSVIACLKSNGFELNIAEIPVVDMNDIHWESSIPGEINWKMNAEGLAIDANANASKISYRKLFYLATNRITFPVRIIKVEEDSDVHYVREGKAYITTYAEQQDVSEPFSFSMSLKGTGQVRDFLPVWSQDGENLVQTNNNEFIIVR